MTTHVEHIPPQLATGSRIRFRQPVNRTGSVDAAWWPESSDLAAELPTLLEVFWTAGRDMTRVVYNLDSWDPVPRTMRVAGKLIRVGGYHYGNPHLMTLTDAWQTDTADLLVIPSDINPAIAERLLAIAAESDNTRTPEQMNELACS